MMGRDRDRQRAKAPARRELQRTSLLRALGEWAVSPTEIVNAARTVMFVGDPGYLAFGDPPPTAADEGTGIFIDATGMYGLEADVVNFYVSASDGKGYFGAGAAVLDASGIVLSGNTSLNVIQGTLTAAAPGWNHTATWNNAAVVFSGLRSNITNTASDDTSALLDLQVGGTSNFKVLKGGAVVSLATLSGTTAILSALTAGRVALVTTAGQLTDDADLTWSTSGYTGVVAAGATIPAIVAPTTLGDSSTVTTSGTVELTLLTKTLTSATPDGQILVIAQTLVEVGTVAGDTFSFQLYVDGTVIADHPHLVLAGLYANVVIHGVAAIASANGKIVKVTVTRVAGTGTLTFTTSSGKRRRLSVIAIPGAGTTA